METGKIMERKGKKEKREREKKREKIEKERKEEKRTFLCNFWIFWVLLRQPYCKQYRAHGHVVPCDLIIVPDWCTEID